MVSSLACCLHIDFAPGPFVYVGLRVVVLLTGYVILELGSGAVMYGET